MIKEKSKYKNKLATLLFIVYLILLTWLILFKLQFSIPFIEKGRVLNLTPFQGSFTVNKLLKISEIRNNIIVFIPFGIYICMLKSHWSFFKKVMAAFFLTFTYEAIQFIFIIGRCDITDIIVNTFGGICGISIYVVLREILKGRTNKFVLFTAAFFTILSVLLISFLILTNRWIRIQ